MQMTGAGIEPCYNYCIYSGTINLPIGIPSVIYFGSSVDRATFQGSNIQVTSNGVSSVSSISAYKGQYSLVIRYA